MPVSLPSPSAGNHPAAAARAAWIQREVDAYDRYTETYKPLTFRHMHPDREKDLELMIAGMDRHIPQAGTVPDSCWNTNLNSLGAITRLRFDPPEAPGEIVPEAVDVLVITLNDNDEACVLLGERKDPSKVAANISNYQGKLATVGGRIDAPWTSINAGMAPHTFQSAMVAELREEAGITGVRTALAPGYSTPGVHFLPGDHPTFFYPRGDRELTCAYRSTIFLPKPPSGTILPPPDQDLDDLKCVHLIPIRELQGLRDNPATLSAEGHAEPFTMFSDHGTAVPRLVAKFGSLARAAIRGGRETFGGQLEIAATAASRLEIGDLARSSTPQDAAHFRVER